MSKRPDDLSLTEMGVAVYRMNLTGNVIPKAWLKHIKMPSGNPDLVACYILSEIVYWYRPNEIADSDGMTIRLERRFWGDKLQLHYKAIADSSGISVSHAKQAIYRLIEFGVLERELRTVEINGTPIGNVPFWGINIEKLYEITYTKPTPPCDQSIARVRSTDGEGTTDQSQGYYALIAYTESTTESTTKKTPNGDFDFFPKNANGKSNGAGLVDAAELDGRVNRDYPQAIDREVGNLLDADQTGNGYSALNDPDGIAESPEQLAALQNYHQQLADMVHGDITPEQASAGLNQDAAAAVDATRQYWLNFVGGVDMAQIAALHAAKGRASGLINNGGAGSTARTTPKTTPTPVNGNGAHNGGNILKVAPKAPSGARKGAGAKVKAGSTG